ncbi:hypothetical protein SODALDRAFT_328974 [Sodiomyces alkalinus F11]|uniref:Zn(2)-C6 fungal-type domain-containing protein n=1 Tax=Sodiomyces alkalinus (strain CBS 110278 / VKM F-3762 / F11) TaxID=1314773 RepID=A0A3N2PM63_SODAK|nr:hypothetical protein SODALDRAFT_328974 [Sodiomyces alkalinus F11]ROT35603.1 hypothetical protein SODALDRAFT_328974 [Sodiomyces alkalinus F11]
MADVPESTDKSRQKSCNACVRSKRRCDKRAPKCARCAEKGFSCVYMNQPTGLREMKRYRAPAMSTGGTRTAPAPQIQLDMADLEALGILPAQGSGQVSSSSPSFDASEFILDGFSGSTSTNDADLDVAMVTNPPTAAPTTLLSFPIDMPSFDFNSLINYAAIDPANGNDMQLWHVPESPKLTEPRLSTPPPQQHRCSPPTDICAQRWNERLDDVCEGMNSWSLHEPNSKLGSVVESFKEFPFVFAREKEVPFIHRHLYSQDTPNAIFRAYAATTAYANRTPSTQGWAFRLIYECAKDLVSPQSTPKISQSPQQPQPQPQPQKVQCSELSLPSIEAAGPPSENREFTVREKLARTHALFLYQLIRCFDGDIGLRAQAERDMPTFQAWLTELEDHRDNLGDQVLLDEQTLRDRPPKSWERWVINESLRRTVMLGHGFVGLYEILKSVGTCEARGPGRFIHVHRWTASRHLWDAKSSVSFLSAWREKPQFVVENLFIQDLAKRARPEDVDSMALIALTAFLGVDEIKHFMAGKTMA